LGGVPHKYEGDSANYLHILARGSTHLPFAKPKFGTEVNLDEPSRDGSPPPRMMGDLEGNSGLFYRAFDNQQDGVAVGTAFPVAAGDASHLLIARFQQHFQRCDIAVQHFRNE
jgi:hypothetical protein